MPAYKRISCANRRKFGRPLAYDSNITRDRKGSSGRSSSMPPPVNTHAEDAPIALAPPGFRTAMEWEGMPCIEFDGRQGFLRVFEVDGVPRIFLQTSPAQAQDSAWPRLCDEVSAVDAFEGYARYLRAGFADLKFGRRCMVPYEVRTLCAVPPFGKPIQSAADWNGSHYMASSGTTGIVRTSTTGQTFLQRHGKRGTWADEVSAAEALAGLRRAERQSRLPCKVRVLGKDKGRAHVDTSANVITI